ncbi:ABC transporter ATP-binding protein [Acidipropionibacterium jensenii]|uniref:ABC transporter ATP-binding protein n=1 Tax=Acidipropionibacterium jensenii TaxID=1749 RepID=UPI0026473DAD|nr:ABC transporter ATP-binding protein [Acidipropionibacterium jensenii]MDN5978306.1 ABC transporter ATP-binding protein [Acidipropionibacterium jensenii]MDN5995153.1 ABC transporter ATP-binding protein [Acidipropionibacterium jensenii]MDN6513947.1 ABC transporter ATP-binding protein [Acidipropionibacterium jensenii]MDN6811965.1 ABC transporter ATP-binding protein [Acidipropionibacterium jensenii]
MDAPAVPASRTVLGLDHVSRVYGCGEQAVHALRDVTLDVQTGHFVSVMGPSGSGKSTLLGLAGGLDQPTEGTVSVCGQPLSGMSRDDLARVRRRQLGFVFQDFNLVSTLTALENVALPLELDGVGARAARAAACEALERIGLSALGDRFIEEMSGGQQQRVAIGRAIVGDRRLLLADEPTGALDSATGDEVMALIRQLADDGVAVVLVTHEARHAAWADRVVFLRDGTLVDESSVVGDPMALLADGPRRGNW